MRRTDGWGGQVTERASWAPSIALSARVIAGARWVLGRIERGDTRGGWLSRVRAPRAAGPTVTVLGAEGGGSDDACGRL